jgi:Tfp pilus assembly protein PilO
LLTSCIFRYADEEEQMIAEIDRIRERLKNLEEEIAETLLRLPAHSAKPSVMIDLLQLEDERDLLLKKLGDLK